MSHIAVGARGAAALLASILWILTSGGCATRDYAYQSIDSVPFEERALSQTKGDATVRVAVPGGKETEAVFGIPLYERGIQPVWVEVQNHGEEILRFAPVGVDRAYFSPLEVPYMYRGGFSKKALGEMNRRFYSLAMPRIIPPGEERSGFVFTHFSYGIKGVNVDLFAADSDQSFAFFVEVPGFAPDHGEVDFDSLYTADVIQDTHLDGLRRALSQLPCCSTDPSGEKAGSPFNVVMVGDGIDVLHALLRARWHETSRSRNSVTAKAAHQFFGRKPDAVFRRTRSGSGGAFGDIDRSELRVWLAPIQFEGEGVWIAQIAHYLGRPTEVEQFLMGLQVDPDFDAGRDYMLQVMWYGQGLEKMAWLGGGATASVDDLPTDFTGASYFTDGFRVVMWLSGTPMSTYQVENIEWDPVPTIR